MRLRDSKRPSRHSQGFSSSSNSTPYPPLTTMISKFTGPPLDMEVCLFSSMLNFERSWTLPSTPSSTPTTSVRGTLTKLISQDASFDSLDGWMKKPPSLHYDGQLPPRVILHVERTSSDRIWQLHALLRGPRAAENASSLHRALVQSGKIGLLHGGAPTRFCIEACSTTEDTNGEWIRRRLTSCSSPERVGLEFVTPCSAPSFTPADLTGNLACVLVKLCRSLQNDPALTKKLIDNEADAVRDEVRRTFNSVRVVHNALINSPRGERLSGETGHAFPMEGKHGFIALEGELSAALPWLALAELHGVGRQTTFGMGRVRLWGV